MIWSNSFSFWSAAVAKLLIVVSCCRQVNGRLSTGRPYLLGSAMVWKLAYRYNSPILPHSSRSSKMLYFPKRGTFWGHGIGTGSLSLPYSASVCRVDPAGGSRKERDAVRGNSDGHRSQNTPFARPRSLCRGVFFSWSRAPLRIGSRHPDRRPGLRPRWRNGIWLLYAIVRMRNCGLPAVHRRHCPGMDIFSKNGNSYITQLSDVTFDDN